MSGKKGMRHYSEEFKNMVREEHQKGMGQGELSKKYGISRYAIQSWCGLRPEVELRHSTPLPKGRPRKKAGSAEEEMKRLRMENELLRNFLSAVGRR